MKPETEDVLKNGSNFWG